MGGSCVLCRACIYQHVLHSFLPSFSFHFFLGAECQGKVTCENHICNNIKTTTNLISDLMKRSLQVSVVVTPESGLISTSIPLAALKSGLQAATSTLDQVQVEATVWEFWSTRVAELVGMWERREIIKKEWIIRFHPYNWFCPVKHQERFLQELGEREDLDFEVEKLAATLLRGGRWKMAQVTWSSQTRNGTCRSLHTSSQLSNIRSNTLWPTWTRSYLEEGEKNGVRGGLQVRWVWWVSLDSQFFL